MHCLEAADRGTAGAREISPLWEALAGKCGGSQN